MCRLGRSALEMGPGIAVDSPEFHDATALNTLAGGLLLNQNWDNHSSAGTGTTTFVRCLE